MNEQEKQEHDSSGRPHSAAMLRLLEEIMAHTEFLLDTQVTERQRERLHSIGEAVRTLLDTNDLRPSSAMSREMAPGMAPEMESVPMEDPFVPANRGAGNEKKQKLNILVAEDNLLTQKLMTRLLELRGHTVEVVSNGLEAVQAVERHLPDLILMDLRMPEMDGLQAASEIRQREARRGGKKRVPIIAVTASTGIQDKEKSVQVGMDGFHAKPVRADLLFAEIDRILNAEAKGGPEIAAPAPVEEPPIPDVGISPDDMEHLLKSVDGDRELLREVVELFFTQAPEQMRLIRSSVMEGNPEQLQDAAHSLKGASSTFGQRSQVFSLAYGLEMMGRQRNMNQALAHYEELEKALARMALFLRSIVQK